MDLNESFTDDDNSYPSAAGGYDVMIAEDAFPELKCAICSLLIRDPVQLEVCGHCMCSVCLQKWRHESVRRDVKFKCPVCRTSVITDRIFENKMMQRIVLDVKVFCKNKQCKWIGELRNLKSHHSNHCEYEVINCKFEGCSKMFERCNVGSHEVQCSFKIISCEYCREEIRLMDLKPHLDSCRKLPVPCINNCSLKIIRCEMKNHTSNDCPLQIVPCNFNSIGCVYQTARRYMNAHLSEKVNQHLQLAVKSNQELKVAFTNHKNEMQRYMQSMMNIRQLQHKTCVSEVPTKSNRVYSKRVHSSSTDDKI